MSSQQTSIFSNVSVTQRDATIVNEEKDTSVLSTKTRCRIAYLESRMGKIMDFDIKIVMMEI